MGAAAEVAAGAHPQWLCGVESLGRGTLVAGEKLVQRHGGLYYGQYGRLGRTYLQVSRDDYCGSMQGRELTWSYTEAD